MQELYRKAETGGYRALNLFIGELAALRILRVP